MKRACADHVEKLRRGQRGITLRWRPGQYEKLKALFSDPQSQASETARAVLKESATQKERRAPNDTHKKRLRGLYVEPSDIGGWNRPCEMGKEEARQLLEDVGTTTDSACTT